MSNNDFDYTDKIEEYDWFKARDFIRITELYIGTTVEEFRFCDWKYLTLYAHYVAEYLAAKHKIKYKYLS